MPRLVVETNIMTRAARARLAPRSKPYWRTITMGHHLGYRKGVAGAGAWITRRTLGGKLTEEVRLGFADDTQEADGIKILSYAQAQVASTAWLTGRITETGGLKADVPPITLGGALEAYQANLVVRGADPASVSRCLMHLPATMLSTRVDALTPNLLAAWRDSLLSPHPAMSSRGKRPTREVLAPALMPASVNRTTTAIKAALNFAADRDPARIGKRAAWEIGLAGLPDANHHRNVVLPTTFIRRIVAAAYEIDEAVGLLVETAGGTGARCSQMARLEVKDLQDAGEEPRLMMPSSMKGRGRKHATRYPVPIRSSLAQKLRQAVAGRPQTARLLLRPDGLPWGKSDHFKPFRKAVRLAGFTDAELVQLGLTVDDITIYALRHSSIMRQLLAGRPIRSVAANHDTSVVMIERNYSALIADHSDALMRGALEDLS